MNNNKNTNKVKYVPYVDIIRDIKIIKWRLAKLWFIFIHIIFHLARNKSGKK